VVTPHAGQSEDGGRTLHSRWQGVAFEGKFMFLDFCAFDFYALQIAPGPRELVKY
jgi:hypothetical protein